MSFALLFQLKFVGELALKSIKNLRQNAQLVLPASQQLKAKGMAVASGRSTAKHEPKGFDEDP
jgi:hypothetical protein